MSKAIPKATQKEGAVIAAFDALAPLTSFVPDALQPNNAREHIRDTLTALSDYPATCKNNRFAFKSLAPDYCILAAQNLLKLALLQPTPKAIIFTIENLLGMALEQLQNEN